MQKGLPAFQSRAVPPWKNAQAGAKMAHWAFVKGGVKGAQDNTSIGTATHGSDPLMLANASAAPITVTSHSLREKDSAPCVFLSFGGIPQPITRPDKGIEKSLDSRPAPCSHPRNSFIPKTVYLFIERSNAPQDTTPPPVVSLGALLLKQRALAFAGSP